jgi:hypothetical protein
MSVRVNFFTQFSTTGVGRHSENAFFSMSRNRPAGLLPVYVNLSRQAAIRRAVTEGEPERDVTIFFWRYAAPFLRQFRGPRAFWWFFESDRLAPKWLEEIEPFDQIWAPSEWGRRVLAAHGVASERLRVIESGVNGRVYRPQARAHNGFVFLSVGKYEKRKSIDETVEAFLAEFPAAQYPDVQLVLKADYPLYPQRVQDLAARLAHDARVRVVSGEFTDEEMAMLYNGADAFVFPSKAEGFGLPCLEAIACAVPVIATCVSAQTAFLDRIPGLFAPVETVLAPIDDEDFRHFYAADFGAGDHGAGDFGNWGLPSIESLRRAMRDVYENRDDWRRRASQAAQIVHEEFSWDVIARKAIAAAQDLQLRAAAGSLA